MTDAILRIINDPVVFAIVVLLALLGVRAVRR